MNQNITINTGSPKCRVLNILECPVCGDEFDIADGKYTPSSTLGESVLLCPKHDMELTADQEIRIQDSLRSAIDNKRGYVSNGKSTLKKSELMKKYLVE